MVESIRRIMLTDNQLKELKAWALGILPDRLESYRSALMETDARLVEYFEKLIAEGGDMHNIYEVLGAVKFLRLMGLYEWRPKAVKRFIKLYESLKFNGLKGRQTYKLTPIQTFQFASIYGFYRDDGYRLCRQAILFVPRKFGKSTACSSLALDCLLFGDSNAQAYMASNSESQSGIVYKEAKALVQQLDPEGDLFRITSSEINWKTPNKYGKESSITRLTAGGRTKDGLSASLCIYDEYAAARYVKDHSDGAELLNVLTSSMGARPEPLTVIITTASRVIEGPFEIMLRTAKECLENERALSEEPEGVRTPGEGVMRTDWQFASVFQPDPWELSEVGVAGRENVWRKCNPHIGITIMPNYYKEEYEQALMDNEKMKEFCCKYLNIFQSDKVRDWISADEIRKLQCETRIDDLKPNDGWSCFMGMDFSKGDDLNCQAYLCFKVLNQNGVARPVWFLDCDAWVSEEQLDISTNSALYRKWHEQGWLRVSPGKTIDEGLVVSRVAEVLEHVQVLQIGYDAYDAKRFVNAIGALVASMGGDPSKVLRSVSQTFGNFNSAVQEIEHMVKQSEQVLWISNNPLLPWCFGNCVLAEDKMENVKPVKRTEGGGSPTKIDLAICALEAVILQDDFEKIK